MKNIICLLLSIFIFITNCSSQDSVSNVLDINKLPAEGITLDKGWKFILGDNPNYANSNYDDSKWQPIDPTKDIYDLPELQKGFVWFRLKIKIDHEVAQQPLSLYIEQRGASEIYINGKLNYHFGIVSANPEKIIAYNPARPFLFPSNHDSVFSIAVRYTLQPGILYTTNTLVNNPAFYFVLNNLDRSITFQTDGVKMWTANAVFRIGVFFILFILHLAFYLYHPSQKANLYFSLFALCVIFTDSNQIPEINTVKYLFYNRNLVLDFLILSNFFLLTAVYSLSNQQRGVVYKVLLALVVLGIYLSAVTYRLGDTVSIFITTNLINLEITRIAFAAVSRKQRGAKIIAAGAIGCLVSWSILLLSYPLGYNDTSVISLFTYGNLTYMVAFLSVPIATSIYLGLDFAFTSVSLKHKLAEVERLSNEKRQILSAQNETLEQQVTERTAQLNRSLTELKSTQAQLIQSEKMASLGELTAGIAHEIQNPLNFVNNFSEVNAELIDEMQQEMDKGNLADAKAISNDIKENEQKINHHGKRADAIVKGMLQHSHSSSAVKEPTDINKLADEYLRLAYHGLHAKDKNFNATLKTDFDTSIGNLNIIPQDIGRVILNLITNAFYAVNEKNKSGVENYEPTVLVSTKKVDDKVLISVKDNGNGIPQKIVDKIFQPFFTTKPTGQGTGLGLSMAYDIVKVYGGDIKIHTEENQGSIFIITLPL